MSDYARWADLAHTVKGLAPPPPSVETGPPGSDEPGVVRTTNSFIGMFHAAQAGPNRGEIEAALSYLGSLAPAEEAGDDAAA